MKLQRPFEGDSKFLFSYIPLFIILYLELESQVWSGEFIWILFLWFLNMNQNLLTTGKSKHLLCTTRTSPLYYSMHVILIKAVQFCLSVRYIAMVGCWECDIVWCKNCKVRTKNCRFIPKEVLVGANKFPRVFTDFSPFEAWTGFLQKQVPVVLTQKMWTN